MRHDRARRSLDRHATHMCQRSSLAHPVGLTESAEPGGLHERVFAVRS